MSAYTFAPNCLASVNKTAHCSLLKACFLKKDGIGYTESLSSLRSQLKNDDYNSTYRLLSYEKRAEIDEIIKSK